MKGQESASMESLTIIVTLDLAGVFDNKYHANDLFVCLSMVEIAIRAESGDNLPLNCWV